MTRDERWLLMWRQYMDFMGEHGRRPSKHKAEERDLVNWMKYNRKMVNASAFPNIRRDKLDELIRLSEKCQHVNQYK